MTKNIFLRQTMMQSAVLMVIVCVSGLIVIGMRFAATVLVSGAIDIATFYLIMTLAWQVYEHQSTIGALELLGAFSGRLVLKGLLLLFAFLYPDFLNVWGALIGVLVIDIMLMLKAGGSMIRRKPLEMGR